MVLSPCLPLGSSPDTHHFCQWRKAHLLWRFHSCKSGCTGGSSPRRQPPPAGCYRRSCPLSPRPCRLALWRWDWICAGWAWVPGAHKGVSRARSMQAGCRCQEGVLSSLWSGGQACILGPKEFSMVACPSSSPLPNSGALPLLQVWTFSQVPSALAFHSPSLRIPLPLPAAHCSLVS